jgi:hypothetical protein
MEAYLTTSTPDVEADSGLDVGESRELALMLAASSGDPDRDAVKRLMAGPLDWGRLTRLAIESHATPGVWAVVSAYPGLPAEADMLHSVAVMNDFRRHHIRQLTARVVSDLRVAGVEVVVLKGAALLVGAVSQMVPRTMSDIDILVVEGSPELAWRTCLASGWTLVDPSWTEDLYRSHHHLPPLLDPDGIEVGLEVHRSLLPGADRLGVDVGAVMRRSRVVQVGDVGVRVPSPEDLLLHDCLHFAWSNKLQRAAWRAFADAHVITTDPRFSWDAFVDVAMETRARQCCYWTLRLGRVLADLAVPDAVQARLDPSSGGVFAPLLERHFVRQILDPRAEAALSERLRRWLWFTALHERGTSDASTNPWNVGAVEVPGESAPSAPPPRGAWRAAISSAGYLSRLVLRG